MAALLPLAICMLACPLLMVVMMKGMGSKDSAGETKPDRAPKPAHATRSREEQLAELKTRMASVQAERETLRRELDQAKRNTPPAAHDAEPGVQAKTER